MKKLTTLVLLSLILPVQAKLIQLQEDTLADLEQGFTIHCSSPKTQLPIYDSVMFIDKGLLGNLTIARYGKDYQKCFRDLKGLLNEKPN